MDLTSVFIVPIVLAVIQTCAVSNSTDQGSDVEELRGLLKNAREINQKLQWNNNRLMAMWSGLAQMCRALRLVEEESTSVYGNNDAVIFGQQIPEVKYTEQEITSSKTQQTSGNQAGSEAQQTSGNQTDLSITENEVIPPLHINYITTKGIGYLNITINYTAPEDHTTEWYAQLDGNGELRSSGNRLGYLNAMFTVYEMYFDPHFLQTLTFRLHAGDKTTILQLNILELGKLGGQLLPEFEGDVTFSQQAFVASKEDSVDIVVTFPASTVSDIALDDTFIYFHGLNASDYSPEPFKYSNQDSDVISLAGAASTEGNASTQNLIVTINPDYARYGGLVTVRPPALDKIGGYVRQLSYERYVTVKSAKTGDVIPNNKVWLANIEKQTTIASEFYSLWCAATGNPTPEVQLLRQLQNGKTKRKRTQTVFSDKYMTTVAHTLSRSDKRRGLYICRATSGNQTVEETTEVQFFSSVVFDETVTGVEIDTQEEIVIKCKATGVPEPQLELWDENINGTKLSVDVTLDTVMEKSKAWRVLTATLDKPVDFSVFCVAKQEGVDIPYPYQIL